MVRVVNKIIIIVIIIKSDAEKMRANCRDSHDGDGGDDDSSPAHNFRAITTTAASAHAKQHARQKSKNDKVCGQ